MTDESKSLNKEQRERRRLIQKKVAEYHQLGYIDDEYKRKYVNIISGMKTSDAFDAKTLDRMESKLGRRKLEAKSKPMKSTKDAVKSPDKAKSKERQTIVQHNDALTENQVNRKNEMKEKLRLCQKMGYIDRVQKDKYWNIINQMKTNDKFDVDIIDRIDKRLDKKRVQAEEKALLSPAASRTGKIKPSNDGVLMKKDKNKVNLSRKRASPGVNTGSLEEESTYADKNGAAHGPKPSLEMKRKQLEQHSGGLVQDPFKSLLNKSPKDDYSENEILERQTKRDIVKQSSESRKILQEIGNVGEPQIILGRDRLGKFNTEEVKEMYVCMSTFAEMKCIQPPSCLRCAFNSTRKFSKGTISETCKNFVAWRRNANKVINKDSLDSNLVFIRCTVAQSLLQHKTIENWSWNAHTKTLVQTQRL